MTTPGQPRLPLSVLIRTLNENDRIARTLKSVASLGAEVVVIDAGSKDDTVAIARGLGAVVYENPWPGFGPQRYFGEAKCANDMVLSLDADEVVTEALAEEIRRAFASGPAKLMTLRKASVFPGYDKPWPLTFCHEQILIYDRRIARTGPNPNWDSLEIVGGPRPIRLRNPIWHYSTRDLNHAVTKAVYVGQLAADTQPVRSLALLTLRLVFEFPIAFFRYYVLRRFFLVGGDGFVYAVVGAYSRWIRVALMRERVLRERR